ncbi:CopG family transcriptional regulator [Oceanobacillus chungangensis]|uniref:CopG family transcriptional regulator n=1 Tax=Oceanobacillus chungangensis TaxID=1229152 RepID=A0A3D8PIF4_9BACI|nr:CopG family transcriptional regulator [Oceanobacillus chungangensis]RDW15021.1 CopG family transcriptional regulator [Oceanobacillus chungangensis]
MAETEKVTVNMNVVDLGKVDLLVEQGFYPNRTDFIKTSIRNQLTSHSSVIENVITVKSYEIGIYYYDRKTLEQVLEQNKLLDIKVVGMLVLKDDVDVELARKTIKSIKVLGVFRASHELKIALKK